MAIEMVDLSTVGLVWTLPASLEKLIFWLCLAVAEPSVALPSPGGGEHVGRIP